MLFLSIVIEYSFCIMHIQIDTIVHIIEKQYKI